MNSFIRWGTFLFGLCMVLLIGYVFFYLGCSEFGLGLIALEVGVLALFQDQLRKWLFFPTINCSIRVLSTKSDQGIPVRVFNLNVKNTGSETVKNIRVKVRMNDECEWVHLLRPFHYKDRKIFIDQLVKGEDDDFNFARILRGEDKLKLYTDIKPNNQRFEFDVLMKAALDVEVVSENAGVKRLKVGVDNTGFAGHNLIRMNNV